MDISLRITAKVRLLTESDIPWLLWLSRKKYPKYDEESTQGWFRNIVLKGPLLFQAIRTDNAFCITMLSVLPWYPNNWEAHVVFICADDDAGWEAVTLLRASIAWAKKRKASEWRCCSETNVDLEPLARRVGATEVAPRFLIRFADGRTDG